MKKIAFQGSKGAYSEQALYAHFGKKDIQAVPLNLSEQVCEAVRDKEVDAAILPVENSIIGNIDLNVDLIYKHKVFAVAEHFQQIAHCLLAREGVNLKDIKTVHSHPAALSQCRDFLNRHSIKSHADYDTAGACKRLIKKESTRHGVIASELCCDYYNLKVIERHIQKVENNFTRFLIIVHQDNKPPIDTQDDIAEKISMAFTTKNKSGALLSCLQIFALHQINLTKLESQPIPENPFEYTFFVDCEASLNDKNMKVCLEELTREVKSIKITGHYPISTKRSFTE